MHKKYLFSAFALSAVVLNGCIDKDYDLENIDATVEFQINDLTLPLNIDPVKLNDLVDLSSEDCVEIVDGEYVLVKEGDFSSDAIEIRNINARPTTENQPKNTVSVPAVVSNVNVQMPEYIHKFNYNYDNVDEYIVSLERGQVDLHLLLSITTQYANGVKFNADYTNLKVALPKGFYGTLDNGTVITATSSNIVTVSSANSQNGIFRLDFHVTEFDAQAAGAKLDNKTHKFSLSTSFGIAGGIMTPKNANGQRGEISVNMDISPLEVNSFTGTVWYQVENLASDSDISLSDLPDVLTQEETDIAFYNPQLYVALNNPLGDRGVTGSVGLEITQIRDNGSISEPARLAQPMEIAGVGGVQEFCLLPRPEALESLYPKFPDATKVLMNNLGDIVKGQGFPEGLRIEFINPMMNQQRVVEFPLGVKLGNVHGDYTLFAPLQLTAGSKIYYKGDASGWGLDSDSDEFDIKYLSLEADVTSNLPVSATLTAKPVNSEGQEIPGVKVSKVEIPGNGTSHVVIKMEGNILDLDGMNYIATLKGIDDTKAISPDSELVINNLKVRVTGNYILND